MNVRLKESGERAGEYRQSKENSFKTTCLECPNVPDLTPPVATPVLWDHCLFVPAAFFLR